MSTRKTLKTTPSSDTKAALVKAKQGDDSLLKKIPADVLRLIAAQLSPEDVTSLCQLSKYFDERICRNDLFWKDLVKRDLTDNPDHLAIIENIINRNKTKANREDANYPIDITSYRQVYTGIYSKDASDFRQTLNRAAILGLDKYLEKVIPRSDSIHVDFLQKMNPDTDLNEMYTTDGTIRDFTAGVITFIKINLMRILVERGYLDILQQLVKKGYNTDLITEDAMMTGNFAIIKFVIENTGEDTILDYSLNRAIIMNRRDLVDYFLEMDNVDINSNEGGETALETALANGNVDMARYLISHGAQVEEDIPEGAIGSMNERDQYREVLEFLFDELHLPIPGNIFGMVVNPPQIQALRFALERGLRPDDPDGLLQSMIERHNRKGIELLFEYIDNLDVKAAIEFLLNSYDIKSKETERIFDFLMSKIPDSIQLDVDYDTLSLVAQQLVRKYTSGDAGYISEEEELVRKYTSSDAGYMSEEDELEDPADIIEDVESKDIGPQPGYCHSKTKKGTWCARRAREGSNYCWQHQV